MKTENDKIIFCLTNTEQNRFILDYVPHRELEDLSIIYYKVSEKEDAKLECDLISNYMAEDMNLTEPQLYELAKENTRKWFPPSVEPIEKVLQNLGMEEVEIPEHSYIHIISNQNYINGAVSILYEDVMDSLAQKVGKDLYLLPSSVNEFIAIPADELDIDGLAETVHFVNMTRVDLQDRLSNQVYRYDKETKQISLATDNIYKNLESVREEWFEDECETVDEETEQDGMGLNL